MEDQERKEYLMAEIVVLHAIIKERGRAMTLLDRAELVRNIALLSIAYDAVDFTQSVNLVLSNGLPVKNEY